MKSSKRSWFVGLGITAAAAFAAVAAFATAGEASQSAALVPPSNTAPPTISGTPERGQTLTANPGTWSGTQPITFTYQWLRCNEDGGACSNIGGANERTYALRNVDVANTLRVRVTARNNDGTATATSAPTAVIRAPAAPPPPAGCAGNAPIPIASVSAPERLMIDGQSISPGVVGRSSRQITVRVHVSCRGKSVQGAVVYAAAVPFNQYTVPAEQQTGADGWASLTMTQLSGFPAARSQQLLVVFTRARKGGEDPLGGVSTRRLVSFPVDLSR